VQPNHEIDFSPQQLDEKKPAAVSAVGDQNLAGVQPLSGRMKLVFFGRIESHLYVGGFSSEASSKKVLLPAVDFLPS